MWRWPPSRGHSNERVTAFGCLKRRDRTAKYSRRTGNVAAFDPYAADDFVAAREWQAIPRKNRHELPLLHIEGNVRGKLA